MIDYSYQGLGLGTSPSTSILDIIGRWWPLGWPAGHQLSVIVLAKTRECRRSGFDRTACEILLVQVIACNGEASDSCSVFGAAADRIWRKRQCRCST